MIGFDFLTKLVFEQCLYYTATIVLEIVTHTIARAQGKGLL